MQGVCALLFSVSKLLALLFWSFRLPALEQLFPKWVTKILGTGHCVLKNNNEATRANERQQTDGEEKTLKNAKFPFFQN